MSGSILGMNARNTVWVEKIDGRIVRIFRSTKSEDFSRAIGAGTAITCPKFDAVGAIRKQIWARCGGRCEDCGRPVTETGSLYRRGHMHEVLPKGNGGEVSLDNCRFLCYNCHINVAHGNRRPQFTKTFEQVMGEE
jgi:HNH endonuclease